MKMTLRQLLHTIQGIEVYITLNGFERHLKINKWHCLERLQWASDEYEGMGSDDEYWDYYMGLEIDLIYPNPNNSSELIAIIEEVV